MLRVVDVQRVEVDPSPPHDSQGGIDELVGVEAQAGGRAHLEQRQRLRQPGQHGCHDAHAARLIGLGPALKRGLAHHVPMGEHPLAIVVVGRQRRAVQPCGGQDQIGLPLGQGQLFDAGQHFRVVGQAPAQHLVDRAVAGGLDLREVQIGSRQRCHRVGQPIQRPGHAASLRRRAWPGKDDAAHATGPLNRAIRSRASRRRAATRAGRRLPKPTPRSPT